MIEFNSSIRIAPSLLSANFVRLEKEIHQVENYVEILHIDVMDGHFVPNLTIGPPVIRSIRKITNLELDVHLMVEKPKNILRDIIKAGSDNITLHYETADNETLHLLIKMIKESGKSAGISLSPSTPASVIKPYLPHINRILCMTVEPGYGGQPFQKNMLEKIETLRELIQRENYPVELEVDGGINIETAPLAVKAGANLLVAGSAIFGTSDPVRAIQTLQQSIKNL